VNSIILQQIIQKADNAGVVEVKKLLSRDLVIQLKEQAEKEVLNRRSAWLEQVSLSVKVLPDLYPVLVYGVHISRVDTTKQTEAARDLELQNVSLHPGLCIKRLSWPRGIQKTEKLSLSLMVFLTSPEMANRVIEQRLVESREVKMVERFQTGCGLVQCFKYCVYRHIAKHCQADTPYICGFDFARRDAELEISEMFPSLQGTYSATEHCLYWHPDRKVVQTSQGTSKYPKMEE
jgi:hypothetical protein